MEKWKMGTPLCGIVCGVIGVIVALMLLFLGFWRTLFVALLFGVGYFIGASKDKGETVKTVINRYFPPKDE